MLKELDKTTDSSGYNPTTKKSSGRRNHFTRRNTMKLYQRTRSGQRISKEKWSILGRR